MHDTSRGPDDDATRYERALPHQQRKQGGVWFTPANLALATAQRTLAPLLGARQGDLAPSRTLRIVDPAAGAGSFLVAAAAVLAGAQTKAATLVGMDRDQQTVELLRQTLERRGIAGELHCGDGLHELAAGSFDCVLANPPWETLQGHGHTREQTRALRQRFRYQGNGKLYTYRLFLERSIELLRDGGRLGFIAPASLWFDREAEPLRRILLDTCSWQWLFGFENRQRVFDIDSRYRFGVVIATKGACTRHVQVAFGRTSVAQWACEKPVSTRYDRSLLTQLSPRSGAFVEIESARDLDVLARMREASAPMLQDLDWRQGDYNMTSDRAAFALRDEAEAGGYRHHGDGSWRCEGKPDLLALRQGAMVYDLDGNAGAHAGGTGHSTRWRSPKATDELRPLYLVDSAAWQARTGERPHARIALRALSNSTNERTAIACLLPDVPCGNSLGILTSTAKAQLSMRQLAARCAMLSSLPFDYALRMRLVGTNLNRFILSECVLPRPSARAEAELAECALRLCATAPWTHGLWQLAQQEGWCRQALPATDLDERQRLATRIDTLTGDAFGLSTDDVAWITRAEPFAKGFWRIERSLPAAARRPARWLAAVRDVERR
ncbi:MAG: N-6 DNA methylase [Planctomycetota bacterium]